MTAPARAALLALVRALAPQPPAAEAAFAAALSARRFAVHQPLLRAGEPARWAYFLVRGLAREYYVAADGQEHTRSFIPEGELTGSLLDLRAGLRSGAPAVTFIEALEPTETLLFGYREFEALCERFPSLHVVARRWAEALYVRKARREYEMLALSARERYAAWLTERAALDGRIQRRHLASYLGVTPEHLSRLRRGAPGRAARAETGRRARAARRRST
ncbi:MAG: Crp/Fnr family transcriptional regulator [Kofleriaceae bacterium]